MKTFDEAIEETLKDIEKLRIELDDNNYFINNDKWRGYIVELANHMIESAPLFDDPIAYSCFICSKLHQIFSFGVLVGMSMEKDEKNTDTLLK